MPFPSPNLSEKKQTNKMAAVILAKQDSMFISTASTTDPNVVISPDGSKISINLNYPISIPAASIHTSMEVSSASIWNISPNISPSYNNNTLTYLIAGVAQAPIVLPEGQYSLSNINQALGNELTNRGQDPTLFTFSGDDATQSIIIVFKATIQIDCGAANSIGSILGYPASEGIVPAAPAPSDGYSVISDQPASLNRINNYLIVSDIVPNGIPLNNSGTGVIASIPITVRPGSQLVYAPTNPTQVDLSSLRGKSKPSVSFTLTDQLLRPVNTLGESWSILLTFRYNIILSTVNVPLLDM